MLRSHYENTANRLRLLPRGQQEREVLLLQLDEIAHAVQYEQAGLEADLESVLGTANEKRLATPNWHCA